jgi:hypothetical protein
MVSKLLKRGNVIRLCRRQMQDQHRHGGIHRDTSRLSASSVRYGGRRHTNVSHGRALKSASDSGSTPYGLDHFAALGSVALDFSGGSWLTSLIFTAAADSPPQRQAGGRSASYEALDPLARTKRLARLRAGAEEQQKSRRSCKYRSSIT